MKYLFILTTWMAAVIAPDTPVAEARKQEVAEVRKQEIPTRNLDACKQMETNLERAWENAPDEFGYVIVCRPNPRFKPK